MNITREKSYTLHSPFQKLITECEGSLKNLHFINILNTGNEALLARIHLIRVAMTSIHIQTFIWKDDETGRLFISELIKAAKRGIKVSLLIDPWASDKNPNWVAGIAQAHPNLVLKYYSPNANEIHPSALELLGEILFHFKEFNQRMHNKLFIIDGQIGIIGGRNYGNDYYNRGEERNFKDRDVLVIGPVVLDMVDSFINYWNSHLSVFAHDLIDVRQSIEKNDYQIFCRKRDFNMSPYFNEIDEKVSDRTYIQTTFIEKSLRVSKIRFVGDYPGKNQSPTLEGGGLVYDEFVKFIQKARRTIIAQTPYLVLGRKAFSDIGNLRKSNPQFDIIISTNSLASTDNIYTYSYACKLRRKYVKNLKFRIFESKPLPADYDKMMGYQDKRKVKLCIHAKTFVVDDESVWIGSLNVDPRSYNLNTEVALIIDDKNIAKIVKDNILVDISPHNSWTVGRRDKVPFISHLSGPLCKILENIPVRKTWPFCYTDNFELIEGKEAVPFYDDKFKNNYVSAGPYPGVDYTLKEVEVMLIKALIEIARPIL